MSDISVVTSDKAPSAIGPYSQAIVANGCVYTSGVVPLNPETMELVGESIEEQAERVMQSLAALLSDADSDISRVVKTSCFLTDLSEFGAFNDVYGKYFGAGAAPARSTFQVSALPKGAKVEVEAVALLGK